MTGVQTCALPIYLAAAIGRLLVNGLRIEARDGVAIKEVRQLTIRAVIDSEFVLVDAPEGRPMAGSKTA